MLFSILIANYNNGRFFNDCYHSIISQTYINWEVIIVDDSSTDNSFDIIKDIIKDDSRFKLMPNDTNKGCGYTKNKCVRIAKGEIAGFLDPDDTLECNALEIMIDCHKRNVGASIITSKHKIVDSELGYIKDGLHGQSIPLGKSYLTFGKGALTAFASFKMKDYIKTDGINIKMKRSVDQDLYYILEEQGNHLFINKFLYNYRKHEGNISLNQNEFKAQYWHFYTIVKAYERRKKRKIVIDNYSTSYIREYKSNYYLLRYKKIKGTVKKKEQFYFLYKALIADPFHKFKFKIKSVILLIKGGK